MSDHSPVQTADGSYTCWHPDYREHYHSRDGARSEAETKFIHPSKLADRLENGPVTLLDVGFGLGGNAFASIRCASECGAHGLIIHSLEKDTQALERAWHCAGEEEKDWIRTLQKCGELTIGSTHLILHARDLRQVAEIDAALRFDLFFHDPFSPMKNPEGWTMDLFCAYRKLANANARLLTYSQAWAVRSGLKLAGWHVAESEATDGHRSGTIASTSPLPVPLEVPEGIKAIPYRDPNLDGTGAEILKRRQDEIEAFRENYE